MVLALGKFIKYTTCVYIQTISSGGHWWRNGNQCQFYSKEILEFNQESDSWIEIGAMKEPRYIHAVSVVSFDDYEHWCN